MVPVTTQRWLVLLRYRPAPVAIPLLLLTQLALDTAGSGLAVSWWLPLDLHFLTTLLLTPLADNDSFADSGTQLPIYPPLILSPPLFCIVIATLLWLTRRSHNRFAAKLLLLRFLRGRFGYTRRCVLAAVVTPRWRTPLCHISRGYTAIAG